MARPLRVEYPGAIYHVMNCGNRRQTVFETEADTDSLSLNDARHLIKFAAENEKVESAYIVCRCPRPQKITDMVTAIPWYMI